MISLCHDDRMAKKKAKKKPRKKKSAPKPDVNQIAYRSGDDPHRLIHRNLFICNVVDRLAVVRDVLQVF